METIKVGSKIKFTEERRGYTVRAASNRFLVCTKPYNLRRTVLYTVVDLKEGVRGTENLIFGMGAETDEKCLEMLERLESGKTKVSHRNRIMLNIEQPNPAPGRI